MGSEWTAETSTDLAEVRAVFRGGPLDGREHVVVDPVEGQWIRHLHLHDGPKIETWYRLVRDCEQWVFALAERG